MKDDLIFDLGMNNGDDTDFYLKKGYKVVAVEPNGQLCALAEQRFAAHIAQDRLTVVHKAVAASPGEISFFLNDDVSGWSTTSANWQQTRVGAQTQTRQVTVAAVTIQELLGQHGTPYYIKTDIQGAELAALEGLLSSGQRPNYI